jgi:hypothetical protein
MKKITKVVLKVNQYTKDLETHYQKMESVLKDFLETSNEESVIKIIKITKS